jgi:hypothetical protein
VRYDKKGETFIEWNRDWKKLVKGIWDIDGVVNAVASQ